VTQVVSPGEYAVRGGLIDLFPMGSQVPFRVDLFDDEIDSIRTFDPDSQRSLYPVPEVRLLPGREFPMDEAARAKFRSRWRELLEGDPTRSRVYKDMGAGVATAGIEYYLPLFFDDTATVFDYLGPAATIVLHGDLEAAFHRFWLDTRDRYRIVRTDPDRPALPPDALFLSAEQFYARAKDYAQLALRAPAEATEDACAELAPMPMVAAVRGAEDPLVQLKVHMALAAAQGQRVLMVGDGLNDAPVLALADVSVAIGQAVPMAQAQSDFIIPGGQLSRLACMPAQAKRTLRTVRQNLLWAGAYNLLCVPLAIASYLPAWMAGLGMALSSLLVMANAARLTRTHEGD
jgi:transcription-repair coupling factor (superfamily II helicase)